MSDLVANWVEHYGSAAVLVAGGLVIGGLYGLFAQRSRFCLRSAAIEFSHGDLGAKLTIWLLAFGMAVLGTQAALAFGLLDDNAIRQIRSPGSMSAAILGGLVFGVGMILARGCPSRLLVLAGQGNLRAVVSGMIFAIAAAATIRGLLLPLRESVSAWWMVQPDVRDMSAWLGLTPRLKIGLGVATLVLAAVLAVKTRPGVWGVLGGLGVGLAVAAAWTLTSLVAGGGFDATPVNGITFSGPSSDVLLRVVSPPDRPLDFETMLVPGTFLGAVIGALIGRDMQLEGFKDGLSMRRYFLGAAMMGIGAVLAGGCAVGSGLTGGGVFSLTAWVALLAIWLSAMAAHRLIDSAG